MLLFQLLFPFIVVTCGFYTVDADDITRDTREGDDVTLECRFSPGNTRETLTYFWGRTSKQAQYENVAIGNIPLAKNYKLNYNPEQGIYDLIISNTSYEQDNGKFECKVKAGHSGTNLHVQRYTLTVLTAPQEPEIGPGSHVTVTEGKRQELTCSSIGGSPDPQVHWYKGSSLLQTALKNGGSRDVPTVATYSFIPNKQDDGAVFRCEVWNRALPENKKLVATVTLDVNYFPRVTVSPMNPYKVERDSQATLQCSVDAKPKISSLRWTRNGRFISTYNNHVIHRVSVQDAGKYTCSAENGLGEMGESDIYLDVLFPPSVTLEAKTKEAEEGESVAIKCNVTANPPPISIEWFKDGKPDFRQTGDTLRLNRVSADNSGTYICRAVNAISPTNQPSRQSERVGNASIALLIRHKPGKARISPDRPVTVEGSSVTLTCTATPPGWPAPQYRWFRIGPDNQSTILITGTKYTITNANLATEGVYNCQATNELGPGETASVTLDVQQPPSFKSPLKPLETKRVGDPNFSLNCSATGKPAPMVRWLKDNEELTADANLYHVKTVPSEGHNGAVSVLSELRFHGKNRPNGNELIPGDRGVYTCSFENEVKKSDSSMHLKIEHEPIVLHQYNKVAYDISETAEVVCKVLSYPKPEFKWFYGSNLSPLQSSSEGHYMVQTNVSDDTFTSILRISNIKKQDYGEYNCQVVNSLGKIETRIRLQPKGAPEKPTKLMGIRVGPNFVTLRWEPGFNGGISNTKYFISYKRVPNDENTAIEGCGTVPKSSDWSEVECQQQNPCNVTHLDQHQHYLFKVKALNTKGNSDHSHEIRLSTRVDRIPLPQRVAYDPTSHVISINVPATCLPLVAVVETVSIENQPIPAWQHIDTLQLQVSGLAPTYKEANLDQMGRGAGYKGRSLVDEPIGVDNYTPRIRMRLCLRTGQQQDHCGEYVEAELGSAYIREASALATPTLIAIVVSCIVFLLFIGLLLIFCRCKRNQSKKSQSKDYEMDPGRPTIIPQQNQAPPPYYPSTGLENKALEHSLDLALAMEDQKNVYATQNGYGYHVANQEIQARQNGGDWANMAYLENSYSNSNNGGSVNSQDSLWQMKMAAVSNNSTNQLQSHINVDRQNSYGYDPITHGGYGAVDDYAPYPHITTQSNHGDNDYITRNSNNPSRQDYCSDPYAAVHKPKKRIEQHIDSPYHDVSGLPDPYLEQMEDEKPPQHMSLSYEESLESGYSTPNSRTRRVIREIIV